MFYQGVQISWYALANAGRSRFWREAVGDADRTILNWQDNIHQVKSRSSFLGPDCQSQVPLGEGLPWNADRTRANNWQLSHYKVNSYLKIHCYGSEKFIDLFAATARKRERPLATCWVSTLQNLFAIFNSLGEPSSQGGLLELLPGLLTDRCDQVWSVAHTGWGSEDRHPSWHPGHPRRWQESAAAAKI